MKRSVLTFGILASAVIFGTFIVMILVLGDMAKATPDDLTVAGIFGYSRYLLLALGIVMAMHSYRKGTQEPVAYGRIFTVGLLAGLITAVLVGAMECCTIAFVYPDFAQQYLRLVLEGLKQHGASAAELAAARADAQSYAWISNPLLTGLFYFGQTAVIGAVIALIAAIFMRRKPSPSASTGAPPVAGQPA